MIERCLKLTVANRKLLFFAFCVVLIIYRAPILFTEPRFYGEEGSSFFAFACKHSWFQSLVMPAISYYSLFLNFSCTLAAKCVPLLYAPWVTTYLSLLLTLLPIILVLWGRSLFFDTPLKQGLICLCTLFFAPGEIWISTTCSQFYLCLITFLILIQDVGALNFFQRWLYRFALGVAALSGVLSCFLTPLFIVKYRNERTRENKIQMVIMLALTIAQLSICTLFVLLGNNATRFFSADLRLTALHYFYYNFLYPLFGQYMGAKYLGFIKNDVWNSAAFFGISSVFIVYVLFVLGMFVSTMTDRKKRVIVYSFFIVSILSTLLSIKMVSGPRYGFMPNILIAIIILSQINFKNPSVWIKVKSGICLLLIVTSLVVGAVEYKFRLIKYSNANWPKWRQEVARWEKNPTHPLRIWPPNWAFRLPAERAELPRKKTHTPNNTAPESKQ